MGPHLEDVVELGDVTGECMDEALNTTRQGMKYWTGWVSISSCCSLGRSFRRESLFMALMMRFLVLSSVWYKWTCLARILPASLLLVERNSYGLPRRE